MNCIHTRIFALVVISALTLLAGSAPAQSQRLNLEIGLSQTQYLRYEPIYVDVTLTNLTSDTVRTIVMDPAAGHHSLDIELINDKGDTFKYSGGIETLTPAFAEGVPMSPAETWYECIDLLLTNAIRDTNLFTRTFLPSLPVGDYKVQLSHTGISSEQLEFNVRAPEGEELLAYQAMLETYRPDGKPILAVDGLIPRWEAFLAKYPDSRYSEKVARDLNVSNGGDAKFLERFPNSGNSLSAVCQLMKSAEDKQAFLKKVIADHPGTRSAKFAEQLLRRREKK